MVWSKWRGRSTHSQNRYTCDSRLDMFLSHRPDGDLSTTADNEECDAGSTGDACCSTSCKLIAPATCSDANDNCCENCALASTSTVCCGIVSLNPHLSLMFTWSCRCATKSLKMTWNVGGLPVATGHHLSAQTSRRKRPGLRVATKDTAWVPLTLRRRGACLGVSNLEPIRARACYERMRALCAAETTRLSTRTARLVRHSRLGPGSAHLQTAPRQCVVSIFVQIITMCSLLLFCRHLVDRLVPSAQHLPKPYLTPTNFPMSQELQ